MAIELKAIIQCQQQGVELLGTLTDTEKSKIDALCSWACPQIIQDAVKNKAPIQKVASDSFLYGIALGLKLQVQAGELKTR
ncbi:MAG: hypothetical protein PHU23_18345 [Dehalococcoidales bacterium]|nr:hypothetical protein [Dehalococcoidales bacterium]